LTTRTPFLFLPQLILLLTTLVVFGIELVPGDERRRKDWLPAIALTGLGGAAMAIIFLWSRTTTPPAGSILAGMIVVDRFALFFQILAVTTTALVVLLSTDYMRDRTPDQGEFYGLLLIVCLAITLVVAAADLLMVYVGIELLSLTSYVLTGYLREDRKSTEAGIKYFLFGATASAAMLYGMSLFYGATRTTNLAAIATALSEAENSLRGLVIPAAVFLLAGFGFKIAAVPFHQWAPDAYEGAPTPITAFLSVGPKTAGFAVLVRVFLIALPNFYPDWMALLSSISIITMIVSNLVAIFQTNVKRMMAYSSISHAGYILIGIVCWGRGGFGGSFEGISGVLIYLLAYLFTNVGAFAVITAFEEATGSSRIEDYAGLVSRSPALAWAMLVFLFSLAGIPGTGGFIGKLYVFGAAIQARAYTLAVVGIITSVIAAFYYLNLLRYVFFQPPTENPKSITLSATAKITLIVTCVLTLAIGLYAQPFLQLAQASANLW
jgi:proton-translocating NADH-quinone oxidoreductase chain N